ncbi:MAG: hypothetical protein QXH26_02440 [Candidatus Hadarchaeales archaeon]
MDEIVAAHAKLLRKIATELRNLELRIQILEKRISTFELCLAELADPS